MPSHRAQNPLHATRPVSGRKHHIKADRRRDPGRLSIVHLAISGAFLSLASPLAHADSEYVIQGRTDSQWNWQDKTSNVIEFSVDIEPDAATAARTNSPADYRSILKLLDGGGTHNIDLSGNNAASSVNYTLPMQSYANSQPGPLTFGPSIYNVIAAWSDMLSSSPPTVSATLDAIWLDAYEWQSGYIYLENQNDGRYGFGVVPGLIAVTNSGYSSPAPEKPNWENLTGGNGGPVTFVAQGGHGAQLNIEGKLGYDVSTAVPDVMSTSLPWRSAGSAISLASVGGNGGQDTAFNAHLGPSGNGGNITANISSYEFNLGPHTALAGQATAPFTAISAVSMGGSWGYTSVLSSAESSDFGGLGPNGNGGDVALTLDDVSIKSSTTGTSYMIGAVAASVGGSTKTFPKNSFGGADVTGASGSTSITLKDTAITLPFNNSIGVIATSTGDQTVLGSGQQTIGGSTTHSAVGNVSITLDDQSSILVGQKELSSTQSAGDTNIGVLANASGNWSRELFTGDDLPLFIPSNVGTVQITSQAKITAYGPNAAGIVAQSIGGMSISSPGTGAVGGQANSDVVDVNDNPLPGASGGTTTARITGGSVTANGDGATGALVQSIGAGGGAGGNSTGLFVAVGGQGGKGGDGGALNVTLSDTSINTTGDYARGVIGQTIGGGGGNGGFAKAYGILVDAGVGGAGGDGGHGGDVNFTATNASVTTKGQHAKGLVFQSIGGGGGTGGADQNADASLGFTVNIGVGGTGGSGGAGGEIDVTLDDQSRIVTTGLDAHGVLLHTVSGGGGAGGAASGAAYNLSGLSKIPLKINLGVAVGGSGGSSPAPGEITVNNAGVIETAGAGSYGLVLQSLGGGGGHGADSSAGSNSWGDGGTNPVVSMSVDVAVGGRGGAAGDGGVINLTNTGTITTSGHNSIGLLAQSIGGGGGVGGTGNAYDTQRWVGEHETAQEGESFSFSVGSSIASGGSGGSAGSGGDVTVKNKRDTGSGFTTLGSGSSAIVVQSIGGGGGVAGDAGTQSIGGNNINSQAGGAGGDGGNGGDVSVEFVGNIQTGRVVLLQYTDSNGQTQTSDPVTIGGNSHGIVAQSIGGGGGMGANADAATSLVPELSKFISDGKILNIKDGIEYWAKKVVDDESPDFDIDYTTTVSTGGTGGKGGDGGNVTVSVPDKSDLAVYGHHSYAILAQSIGGGGGTAGSATSNSLLSGDIALKKLGSDADVGMTLGAGGSGGASGNGGDVTILVQNLKDNSYVVPNNPNPGNLIRTGGFASHAVFAQSVGGGGGVVHEGSILGWNSVQGWQTPKATLGHVSDSPVAAGDGGNIVVGQSETPFTGWIYTAGDASSVVFAQSVGGGGGTISFGCTSNGKADNKFVNQSPCFTDAKTVGDVKDPTTFTAGKFINTAQRVDLTLSPNGGAGGEVDVFIGDSHLVTDGDRSIAVLAQSIGGGGGYVSAAAQNIGSITQPASPDYSGSMEGGTVNVTLAGGQGGSGSAYVGTYGDGSWGVLAQSIGAGGGLFGDTSLDMALKPTLPKSSLSGSPGLSGQVSVKLADARIETFGKNAHGIVAQSWSYGGGIFGGSGQNPAATLVLGSKLDALTDDLSTTNPYVSVSIDAKSSVSAQGPGSVAIIAQTNINGSESIIVDIAGAVSGGQTYTNTAANNRVVQGVGVKILGGTISGEDINVLNVDKGGSITTQGGTQSGYAVVADAVKINNAGTITGSTDTGSSGSFNNLATGVLNTGAIYKVGNNSLHNYGTINIGDQASVGTTRLDGRFVQHESGRMLVTFDALGEQPNDRLIVNGTAIVGGTIQAHAKSLLPGNYEFLSATDLTVTGQALDRLLYSWNAEVDESTLRVTPNQTFHAEGLSASPTSRNLVSYFERAWNNADPHHAELFGYKHELESIGDYNSLLEGLGGQALNAQPLQMRMAVLSALDDSMGCPAMTPNGLRLGDERCVWTRITGEVSELSASANNIGYNSRGGGLRLGVQQPLTQGWTVGASAGYALNNLSATNFSSNGQMFDLSLSARRDLGPWSFGGSIGYAQGWFDNSRSVSAPATGIAPGFNRQYNSNSRLSVYSARLRAAYTFEHDTHYIRPYVDLDLAYSQSPGFSETGAGKLALQTRSNNQWNVAISPMLEYGTDFVHKNKTRVKFYVSAGATFLPGNKQVTPTSFSGAQAANGTFDVITNGPTVLGRLNLGLQIYEQEGYEVRAQYGLQAGDSYWSQSLSLNAVFRF